MRPFWLTLVGTLLCLSSNLDAQERQLVAAMEFKPYLQVKPVAGDERIVRVFVSPACRFSRQYFGFFKNLARTMPNGKTLAMTPLVNRVDGVHYALAHLAVQRFYPKYLENFIEASMIGVQDKGIATANWAGIERIGKAAGLPVSVPRLVNEKRDVLEEDLQALLGTQKQLGITNTPAVAVVGTYIVTPEFTKGDFQQFSMLVNAVISMAM